MRDSAPSLSNAQALLSLTRIRGIGRQTAVNAWGQAIDMLGDPIQDPRDVFDLVAHETVEISTDLWEVWEQSGQQLMESWEAGLDVVSYFDADYPTRLRDIPDPPVVLFAKGRLDALHEDQAVAVVGTREPTKWGERTAKKVGQRAADLGIVVVSGLALGCDTRAHEGCADVNGTGVAVMAHGLDRVYPAANRELAARLLDAGGCLVSEYPVGVRPGRWAFVDRDRIQSGLSDGVLVIETDVKGGTMHTVGFAQKQSRRLACIDHPDDLRSADKARGNRKLIDSGEAEPISDKHDLVRFLRGISAHPTSLPESDHMGGAEPDGLMRQGATEPRLALAERFDNSDEPAQSETPCADAEPAPGSESGMQMPMLGPEMPDVPTVKELPTYRPSEDAVIALIVSDNPKRAGTAARTRYDLYISGMTVGQYISAGGTMDDLYLDIARVYIAVSDFPYAELATRF